MSQILVNGDPVELDGNPVYLGTPEASVIDARIAGGLLYLTFSATVYGSVGPSLSLSGGAAPLVYDGGQGTLELRYRILRRVFVNETGNAIYVTGDLADSVGQPVDGFSVAVQIDDDAVAPVCLRASLQTDGESLVFDFDEPIVNHAGFTVWFSGGSADLTYAAGDGTRALEFSISRAVLNDEVGRATYQPGNIEDLSGNLLLPLSINVDNFSAISSTSIFDAEKKGALGSALWSTVALSSHSISLPGAGSDPSREAGTGALLFDAAATETVYAWLQIPNGWVVGTSIYVDMRWSKTAAGAGGVTWRIRYKYANPGASFGSWSDPMYGRTTIETDAGTGDQYLTTELGRILIDGAKFGVILGLEISRIGSDDAYASDARLLLCNVSYKENQVGSEQLFNKYRTELTYLV